VLASKGDGRRRKAPPILLPVSVAQQRLREDVGQRQAAAAAMRAAIDAWLRVQQLTTGQTATQFDIARRHAADLLHSCFICDRVASMRHQRLGFTRHVS
jgi:hypothetical protein